MKDSTKYVKTLSGGKRITATLESAPGLIYGGCHGGDEKLVFDELCKASKKRLTLPERRQTTAAVDFWPRFANKMQHVG